MNRHHFFALALVALSPGALAQVADTSESVQIQATTGPVTATSSQPAQLAKASDYKVKVADFDANGDNRLSRREIPADHALSFEFHLVDRNHNGYITDAELEKANWR